MNKKSKAFTLAEVLITLTIIGVVAAFTIPTVMKNVEKHKYIVGHKKAYTIFNQALASIMADAGTLGDLAGTGIFAYNGTAGASSKTFGDELVKYIKVAKNCGISVIFDEAQACMTVKGYYYYDGSQPTQYSTSFNDGTRYNFVTADGFDYSIYSYAVAAADADCKKSLGTGPPVTTTCAAIAVDVNGTKKPNVYGKDILLYRVPSNGILYPYGGQNDSNPWTSYCIPGVANGGFCAGRVIEESWQMNYW